MLVLYADFASIRIELNDLRNSDCRSGPCKDFYQGLLADQGACNPPRGLNGEGDLPGHASAVFVITDRGQLLFMSTAMLWAFNIRITTNRIL